MPIFVGLLLFLCNAPGWTLVSVGLIGVGYYLTPEDF